MSRKGPEPRAGSLLGSSGYPNPELAAGNIVLRAIPGPPQAPQLRPLPLKEYEGAGSQWVLFGNLKSPFQMAARAWPWGRLFCGKRVNPACPAPSSSSACPAPRPSGRPAPQDAPLLFGLSWQVD